eukprot:COSAG06_NODE_7189_length_2591_cov_1.691814_2_plen_224_part_01
MIKSGPDFSGSTATLVLPLPLASRSCCAPPPPRATPREVAPQPAAGANAGTGMSIYGGGDEPATMAEGLSSGGGVRPPPPTPAAAVPRQLPDARPVCPACIRPLQPCGSRVRLYPRVSSPADHVVLGLAGQDLDGGRRVHRQAAGPERQVRAAHPHSYETPARQPRDSANAFSSVTPLHSILALTHCNSPLYLRRKGLGIAAALAVVGSCVWYYTTREQEGTPA